MEDWIYQNAAFRQDYTVSIAGKKEEMSYYSSLNYVKNEVILKVTDIVLFVLA